jgi:hypothetical protein
VLKQCAVAIVALPAQEAQVQNSTLEETSTVNSHDHGRRIPSTCPYCESRFRSKADLKKHIKSSHQSFKVFWCQPCNFFFKSVDERRDHILQIHNYQCIYCIHKPVLSQATLRLHIEREHRNEMVKCDYSDKCGAFFKTEEDKQKHLSKFHIIKRVKCRFCSSVVSYSSWGRHMRNCHKDLKKCIATKQCREYFKTKVEMDRHVSQMHSLNCIYCGVGKLSNTLLWSHIKYHHRSVFTRCRIKQCFTFFHLKEEERTHFEEKHAERVKAKIFKCSECNFKSLVNRNLINHQEQHLNGALRCSICNKNFKSPQLLKVHVYHVHRPKTKCVQCGKFVKNLSSHQKGISCKKFIL